MATTQEDILKLTLQLYPTGRAFKHAPDTDAYKYQNARAAIYADMYDDALAVLNAILPDNDGFTAGDATRWEQRLGMIVQEDGVLADRKAAIQQKYNYPGDILARQSADYLQDQLQAAGFDLYVYENTAFVYPDFYDPSGMIDWEHGELPHGYAWHGPLWGDVIANSLDPDRDLPHAFRSNMRGTFFVGGASVGAYANVLETRRKELRRLLLQLKPCDAIGFLFVNYTY